MSDKTQMQKRVEELREIERANGGVLLPEAVVERAADTQSALHGAFEWDDTEAARKYRLEQARQLIRVSVVYEPYVKQNVQAFVSVKIDRYDEGGYRYMPTLLRSKDGRAAVLETAIWELDAFQRKYNGIEELAGVFAESKKLKASAGKEGS